MYVTKELTETLNHLMTSLDFEAFGVFGLDKHREGLVILEGEAQATLTGICAMVEVLSEKTDTPYEKVLELIAKCCKKNQERERKKETQEKTKKENIK